MPFPVAHSLAGTAIYAALDEEGVLRPSGRLAAVILLANAPDLDLIPGLLIGDPNRFHHGFTHTLLAALLVGALAAGAARLLGRGWRIGVGPSSPVAGMFAMVTLAWASHILLDAFSHDSRPPIGVPMLSPFLQEPILLGSVFLSVNRVAGPSSGAEFFLSMLSWHNVLALAREVLLLAPLVVAARWLRRARG